MNLPTPPRRSWFAVWKWKWWVWGVIVGFAPVLYILTAGSGWMVLLILESELPRPIGPFAHYYYEPARRCAERFVWLRELHDWQIDRTAKLIEPFLPPPEPID